MNTRKFTQQASVLVEDAIASIREAAIQAEERIRNGSSAFASSTRKSFTSGRDAIVSAEQTVADHIKEHPAPYIIATISLVALLIGKLLLDQRIQRDWR
jgi:hypothetical protein